VSKNIYYSNCLRYGFFFNKSLFFYNYWYKNFPKKDNFFIKDDEHLNNYYRRYFYSHKTLSIEHSYLLREKTPEYFPLRTYFIKYLNWIVVSVQWFKPAKISYTIKNTLHKNTNFNIPIKKVYKLTNRNVRYKLYLHIIPKLLKIGYINLNLYNF
jgi:hypothetical protein